MTWFTRSTYNSACQVVSAPKILPITIHFFKKRDVKGRKNKFEAKRGVKEVSLALCDTPVLYETLITCSYIQRILIICHMCCKYLSQFVPSFSFLYATFSRVKTANVYIVKIFVFFFCQSVYWGFSLLEIDQILSWVSFQLVCYFI